MASKKESSLDIRGDTIDYVFPDEEISTTLTVPRLRECRGYFTKSDNTNDSVDNLESAPSIRTWALKALNSTQQCLLRAREWKALHEQNCTYNNNTSVTKCEGCGAAME